MPYEKGRKIISQTEEISPNKYPLYHTKKLWTSAQFGLLYLYKALHSRWHLSFLCVTPTRKSTPKHVLLMQNWKPDMQLNFAKPETLLLKRWNSLRISVESHCSGWPLPVQHLKCLFLITREKCVAPAHHSSNHAPRLWAVQQQICWGSRKGKQQCPTPLPLLVGEAQAASPPEGTAGGKAVRGYGWRSTQALILTKKPLVRKHSGF